LRFLAFVLIMTAGAAPSRAADPESEAVTAAKAWLVLVDEGRFAKSWDRAAAYFRAGVNRQQWVQSMVALRKPLGDVRSRKVRSAKYETVLPGAPDGQYVVIRFSSRFANKQSAVESVTAMKDPDGVWRVSGYYIK
jgi:hypothetical protein